MATFFGVVVILFSLKIYGGKGLFRKFRTTDPVSYKAANKYKRDLSRLKRRELDLNFLLSCVKKDVLPSFTDWKVFKIRSTKETIRERKRLLKFEVAKTKSDIKYLKKQKESSLLEFKNIATFLKFHIIKYAVEKLVSSEEAVIKQRKNEKLKRLINIEEIEDGICDNPNLVITNLTGDLLSEDEIEVLKLGLKYGIALRPRENDLIVKGEVLWDQVQRKELLKPGAFNSIRAKNSIKNLAYSLLDVDLKQYFNDSKKVKLIKNLKEKYAILKPDKGTGIVVVKRMDYFNLVEAIFKDKTKFKMVDNDKDPTLTNLESFQRYLLKLLKEGEITEEIKDSVRPKAGNYGRAHALPKVHKKYEIFPPFRPIVDMTGTIFSKMGKYLCELLQPLSINEFSVKDSFEMADAIKSIPKSFLDDGYVFVSFDVVSLFTNVPLEKTVNIILDRVFNHKLISTNLKRRSLKKLILDTCRKTVFSFNNVLYKQIEGVSMGACLGPLLANVIMTEFENVIIKPLLRNKTLGFYKRYVDDTLVLVKKSDIGKLLPLFNSYHKDIQFTVDVFEDGNIHFLDLKITDQLEIDVYHKDTCTGQFVHYSSFVPWQFRISWARSLYYRYVTLCSNSELLSSQLRTLKNYLSWNGFPKYVRDGLLRKFKKSTNSKKGKTQIDDCEILYLKVPYLGKEGDGIVKRFKKKFSKYLCKNVCFRVIYQTNKLSMFCSMKDRYPTSLKCNVIYLFNCPHCNSQYVGKTERNLCTRLKEHAEIPTSGEVGSKSSIFKHLDSCINFKACARSINECEIDNYLLQTVHNNTKILASSNDWLELSFLESYFIKSISPVLNNGVKASKELSVFI